MGDLQGLRYCELSKTNPIGYEALVSKDEDRELPVSTPEIFLLA